MKRILLLASVLGIAAVSLLVGCKKESSVADTKTALVSAEKNSFQAVTARLDAGGDLYLYLSTEQLLEGLSGKFSAWRQLFASLPDTSGEQREQISKAFDLITALVKDSGIEDVSGLGVSSIATETNFYHSKVFLHHYPSRGTGFLWKLCGQQPHALAGLDMLPSNTALATFSDLDVPLFWSEIRKQVGQAGIPQAEEFLNKLPDRFEQATGLKWDAVLGSLGGEFGLVITLDDSKMIPVPLPTTQGLEVPEPGLMIVAKVKDDTIFNRLDEMLKKMSPQLIVVDKPDLKMRTMPVPLPLPIQLRPTVATSGGYLFIATTDGMIQEVLAAKSGQKPGLKSSEEFKHLAKDVLEQGNQFTFVSQRFARTLMQIQRQVLEMNAKTDPAQKQLLESLLQPDRVAMSYCVSANTDEGWLSVGNGNQHPTKVFLATAVAVPAGMLAAVAIPNFVKAREVSQRNACINNLRQINAAKQQWALEKGMPATAMPSQDDLKPYLGRNRFPVCPQGGHYTVGAVNEQAACSIPGHSLSE